MHRARHRCDEQDSAAIAVKKSVNLSNASLQGVYCMIAPRTVVAWILGAEEGGWVDPSKQVRSGWGVWQASSSIVVAEALLAVRLT